MAPIAGAICHLSQNISGGSGDLSNLNHTVHVPDACGIIGCLEFKHMAMYPPEEPVSFSPSEEQLERERALKRFNRLYIFVPIGIAVAIGIFLLVLMLIGIFAPGLIGAEAFLSGLADTILVLWMMPMMVLCAIVPIVYVGYLINRRQRRNMLPPDSPLLRHSRTQMALWQAQNIADRVEKSAEDVSDQVAKPFININSFVAYVYAWLMILLTRPFRRNNDYDPDGVDKPDGAS
jgi:hypothetical protein